MDWRRVEEWLDKEAMKRTKEPTKTEKKSEAMKRTKEPTKAEKKPERLKRGRKLDPMKSRLKKKTERTTMGRSCFEILGARIEVTSHQDS